MQDLKNSTAYKKNLRNKVLDTAMTLFANRGVRAVKMDDIANSLQISKRTLYELYDNKELLLLEGLKTSLERRTAELKVMTSSMDNVMDVILFVFEKKVEEFNATDPSFYDDIVRYPKVLDFFEKDKQQNQRQMVDFMLRGVEQGYFRECINYELIATMFEQLHKIIMANRLYVTYSMQEILTGIIFVFLRGVCTDKGIRVLDEYKERI